MKRVRSVVWSFGFAAAVSMVSASGCTQEVKTVIVHSDSGVGEDGQPDGEGPEDADDGGEGEVRQRSCNGLADVCGDKGNTSCCSSLLVPGGSFLMGRSTDGDDECPSEMDCRDEETPEHEVMVGDFFLDEFEVTVGRFRRFVDKYDEDGTKPKAGAGAHPKIPGSGWKVEWDTKLPSTADELKNNLICRMYHEIWRDTPEETEQHPINCVDWYVAFAFCAWDGGRLPTEAEWEKAAAGGDENRLYPWGSDEPDHTRAAYACQYNGGSLCTHANVAKVGMLSAGQGRWGHKDLAGNMREWVLDWYDMNWYRGDGKTCTDCANLNTASSHVLRGGDYSTEQVSHLRAAHRFSNPGGFGKELGFRCARDSKL